MIDWLLTHLELRRWDRAGWRPRLWLRDDDAEAPSRELSRLVGLTGETRAPVALAVIPQGVGPELCRMINAAAHVSVLQHGVRHQNRAAPTRPSEFPPGLDSRSIAAEIRFGWEALQGFDQRLPIYVPPWNRLEPGVCAALPAVGLVAVSAWGRPRQDARIDAHVDLMRWRPRPRFAGQRRILARLRTELRARRRARRWKDPIGILSHHAAFDPGAWRFLDRLLNFRPIVRYADWWSADDLFGLAPPDAP